jgi:hypothetical protein
VSNPLLDRQTSLLEYLTSGAVIFANRGDRPFESGPHNRLGIDKGLLHLEARYSHEKRMSKIKWVLQTTFDRLGSDQERIIREFTEACPPTGINRLDNVRQFHDFLKAHWQKEAYSPPYLLDVASFELAYATVRGDDDAAADATPQEPRQGPRGAIRRNPRAILLCCSHDIRPILEGRHGEDTVALKNSRFALSLPRGSSDPVILAASDELFAILETLDGFTDPDVVEKLLGSSELVAEFTANGLLEVSL